MKHAMIIDYAYCTGCRSCEISCRKEKDLPLDQWGIQVAEIGPDELGGKWEWDFLPTPSHLCDLCAERREKGKVPACQLHCLAKVIEVVPVEEVSDRMAELDHGKAVCYLP